MASSVQALDLGALHVYSEAGQSLDAEIQLLDVEGLSADDIQPRFAGVDDLALSGLDDKRYLSDVRFFVAIEKDKSATLRLVSDQPINQSFLSFLLEVNWPQGRLLREYTALLKGDVNPAPPAVPKPKKPEPAVVKSASPKASVAVPQVEQALVSPAPPVKPVLQAMQSEPLEVVHPAAAAQHNAVKSDAQDFIPEPAPTVVDTPQNKSPQDSSADVVEHSHPIEIAKPVFVRNSDRVYVNAASGKVTDAAKPVVDVPAPLSSKLEVPAASLTQSGESLSSKTKTVAVNSKQTLWDIASRHRPQGEFSNQQMMLALYNKNPQAFIDGDINRMKGRAKLSLPTLNEIERHDPSEALKAIRRMLSDSSELASKQVVSVSRASEVVVGPKETLWDIAVKYRTGPEVNTRQMMLAIVKKNPHAFVGGNINQMQNGAVLQMPTAADLRQWTKEGASAEIRRQISDWKSGGAPSKEAVRSASNQLAVRSTAPMASKSQREISDVDGGKSLVIGKKETLWTIALENLPDGSITTGEMIKAIIKKNPHAFVNGNMNEMRVGEVLNMPTLTEIHELKGN